MSFALRGVPVRCPEPLDEPQYREMNRRVYVFRGARFTVPQVRLAEVAQCTKAAGNNELTSVAYVTGMATKLGVDHKSNRQYGMALLMVLVLVWG